jgi:hypothetical protein
MGSHEGTTRLPVLGAAIFQAFLIFSIKVSSAI